MNQRERLDDFSTSLLAAFSGMQANLWTALPGIVSSYNAEQGTCVIVPAVRARIQAQDGSYSWVQLSPLVDVPVVFMGGGAGVLTFPIAAGDEALVIFASRCIDGWWQNGGVQIPPEIRMHDPSDGFAIIGPRSLARSLANVSTTATQLRSLDGSTYVELAAGQIVNIVAPGGVNINGLVIDSSGNVTTPGKVTATGEGTFSGIPVSTHLHTGVTSGGDNTGAPIA